jgi:carbamoyl-phosphate synthase small subunit
MEQTKAYLLLEDGTFFEGKPLGRSGTAFGEICFNTGMTGYQEVFTDPSYKGQTIIMTNPHIGNYGAMDIDMESKEVQISGLICKKYASKFSRLQANTSLNDFLEDHNVVGISDIDTRALVTHVRSKGAMNCVISTEMSDVAQLKEELKKAPNMNGLELASVVSTPKAYTLGNEDAKYRVAVLDLGIKQNILNCLSERDFYIKVFPAKTNFKTLAAFKADGYFISNGPGDPAAVSYAVDTVKEILAKDLPLFGICLGHQILALANGIGTYKMHHGHRGLNHPVKNIITGKSEITSQNHGFEVNVADIKASLNVEITHVNLNDNTVEGIRLKNKKAFSVQYHPEASPGPHDSRYLFEQFEALMIK